MKNGIYCNSLAMGSIFKYIFTATCEIFQFLPDRSPVWFIEKYGLYSKEGD